MTFDKFKASFMIFLEDSTVNLGRKGTRTRDKFLQTAAEKFDVFESAQKQTRKHRVNDKKTKGSESILCIKPTDPRRGLDVGKGVKAMTPSESMRADEELNRSPYSGKKKVKEER